MNEFYDWKDDYDNIVMLKIRYDDALERKMDARDRCLAALKRISFENIVIYSALSFLLFLATLLNAALGYWIPTLVSVLGMTLCASFTGSAYATHGES